MRVLVSPPVSLNVMLEQWRERSEQPDSSCALAISGNRKLAIDRRGSGGPPQPGDRWICGVARCFMRPDREEQLWIDAAARDALTPVHVFTIPSAAPDRARMSRWPAPWPAVRRACRATGDKCAIEEQPTRVGRRMAGVRRPPDQTCDRCGPAVGAAYGVRRDGEFYLCRTARTGSGLARRQGRASAATS